MKQSKIDDRTKLTKSEKEILTERAVNILKSTRFHHEFVIMDARIFVIEAERAFNTGYQESFLSQSNLVDKLRHLTKKYKMDENVIRLQQEV